MSKKSNNKRNSRNIEKTEQMDLIEQLELAEETAQTESAEPVPLPQSVQGCGFSAYDLYFYSCSLYSILYFENGQ